MRFLIDNALPPQLAWLLTAEGHDAVHVGEYGLHDASDAKILARALAEARIVVSADTDFGTLLALQEASAPSFICSATRICRGPRTTLTFSAQVFRYSKLNWQPDALRHDEGAHEASAFFEILSDQRTVSAMCLHSPHRVSLVP